MQPSMAPSAYRLEIQVPKPATLALPHGSLMILAPTHLHVGPLCQGTEETGRTVIALSRMTMGL